MTLFLNDGLHPRRVSKKKWLKGFSISWIDSTPRKKIFIMITSSFERKKNVFPKKKLAKLHKALASTAEYLYVNDVPWPWFFEAFVVISGCNFAGFSLLRRLPFWFFWQIETQTSRYSLFWKEIHFLRFGIYSVKFPGCKSKLIFPGKKTYRLIEGMSPALTCTCDGNPPNPNAFGWAGGPVEKNPRRRERKFSQLPL